MNETQYCLKYTINKTEDCLKYTISMKKHYCLKYTINKTPDCLKYKMNAKIKPCFRPGRRYYLAISPTKKNISDQKRFL